MRVPGEQGADDRDHVLAPHADVHVHSPDQHLPAPPLGAGDQLLVAVSGGEQLVRPLGEGVGAGAVEVDAELVGHRAHHRDQLRELVDRLGRRTAHAGGQLDGVAQQLLVHARLLAVLGRDEVEELRGGVDQVAAVLVDERELPLHAERRGRGLRELDRSRRHGLDRSTPTRRDERAASSRRRPAILSTVITPSSFEPWTVTGAARGDQAVELLAVGLGGAVAVVVGRGRVVHPAGAEVERDAVEGVAAAFGSARSVPVKLPTCGVGGGRGGRRRAGSASVVGFGGHRGASPGSAAAATWGAWLWPSWPAFLAAFFVGGGGGEGTAKTPVV